MSDQCLLTLRVLRFIPIYVRRSCASSEGLQAHDYCRPAYIQTKSELPVPLFISVEYRSGPLGNLSTSITYRDFAVLNFHQTSQNDTL